MENAIKLLFIDRHNEQYIYIENSRNAPKLTISPRSNVR